MDVRIVPSKLKGVVDLPSSKSVTHRALFCAALSNGTSRIDYPLDCEDTQATILCLQACGVKIEKDEESLVVISNGVLINNGRLDVRDSATTLRLLIPILLHFQQKVRIYASNRLIQRIQTPDLDSLRGVKFSFALDYIDIEGKLENHLELSERLTTQWISGLLLTLPLKQRTLIVPDAKSDYIHLTVAMMRRFGVEVLYQDGCFKTKNNYHPVDVAIEADYSNASFFFNMHSFNPITINRIHEDSIQGDKIYPVFLSQVKEAESVVEISLEYYPDLAIPLACFASVSTKTVRLSGLGKLALKESNRLVSVYTVLKALGANITIEDDSLLIVGLESLLGNATIDSFLDHRIVMGVVSIASKIENPFVITRSDSVRKSYPNFFEVFAALGGRYEI